MIYGLTTAEDIRIFLELWPEFRDEFTETWNSIPTDEHLTKDHQIYSWCHLYELSIKEHTALMLSGILQNEQFLNIFKELASTKNQIAGIPKALKQVDLYFESIDPPTLDEKKELMPLLISTFGIYLSVYHSLRFVLYHGCFLNELIERIRIGERNDKPLFDAIRIDPTVIGCKTVIARISKAALIQDTIFLTKLKAAINGKSTKLEQQNYQKMRLVFEILHEAKTDSLNDAQLYELFVKTLKLYSWNESQGGNAKALRKFADTYMKKQATT